ncbi:helix-turn-helix domain-containing protein [Paraburkholderia sediminicola]|uniref:MarR family transcriptional regulator n=1 Tax=Paraburkholderia sediminicola TaxID=458836 RepID=UPI0038BB6CDC
MSINAMRIVWGNFPRGSSEMLAMLALADWCDDDGRSLYPSMNAIAKKCRLSQAQARRIVHRFIAEGLVEVVANPAGGNRGQTPHYWLRLDRLTPSADVRGCTGARGCIDAHDPLHGCAGPLAPMQANPPLTISKGIHQRDDTPSARRLPACPVQTIVDAYHDAMPDNPRVKIVNAARHKAIAARWQEASRLTCQPFDGGYETQVEGVAKWREFFVVCARSEFLTGHATPQPGRPPFVANLDFLMSPKGFTGCLENRYHRESA